MDSPYPARLWGVGPWLAELDELAKSKASLITNGRGPLKQLVGSQMTRLSMAGLQLMCRAPTVPLNHRFGCRAASFFTAVRVSVLALRFELVQP